MEGTEEGSKVACEVEAEVPFGDDRARREAGRSELASASMGTRGESDDMSRGTRDELIPDDRLEDAS